MERDIYNRFLFLILLYDDILNEDKQDNGLSMVWVRFLLKLLNGFIAK